MRHIIALVALLISIAGTNDACWCQAVDEIEFKADIVYGQGAGEPLRLDLALPQNRDEPAPCIVVIHGGAWRSGNKNGHRPQIRQYARQGYVAATVQYRFCPEHVFPAQVEDVKCAVRYLRAHAEDYKIDPQRIGAVGFSAGAHLAMMLGTMDKEDGLEGDGGWADQRSKVQAVVAFFGPTDLAADDIPDRSRPLLRDFIGGSAAEKPEATKQASPLTYVSRDDAPMLLFQGTKDGLVPFSQAFKMVRAMTKAEVPGRVELLVGAGHGWGGKDRGDTLAETTEFFDRHLRENND